MSSLLRSASRPALRIVSALYVASFGLLTTLCLAVPAHAAAADEATRAEIQSRNARIHSLPNLTLLTPPANGNYILDLA